jgi:hypothetical protein
MKNINIIFIALLINLVFINKAFPETECKPDITILPNSFPEGTKKFIPEKLLYSIKDFKKGADYLKAISFELLDKEKQTWTNLSPGEKELLSINLNEIGQNMDKYITEIYSLDIFDLNPYESGRNKRDIEIISKKLYCDIQNYNKSLNRITEDFLKSSGSSITLSNIFDFNSNIQLDIKENNNLSTNLASKRYNFVDFGTGVSAVSIDLKDKAKSTTFLDANPLMLVFNILPDLLWGDPMDSSSLKYSPLSIGISAGLRETSKPALSLSYLFRLDKYMAGIGIEYSNKFEQYFNNDTSSISLIFPLAIEF